MTLICNDCQRVYDLDGEQPCCDHFAGWMESFEPDYSPDSPQEADLEYKPNHDNLLPF